MRECAFASSTYLLANVIHTTMFHFQTRDMKLTRAELDAVKPNGYWIEFAEPTFIEKRAELKAETLIQNLSEAAAGFASAAFRTAHVLVAAAGLRKK